MPIPCCNKICWFWWVHKNTLPWKSSSFRNTNREMVESWWYTWSSTFRVKEESAVARLLYGGKRDFVVEVSKVSQYNTTLNMTLTFYINHLAYKFLFKLVRVTQNDFDISVIFNMRVLLTCYFWTVQDFFLRDNYESALTTLDSTFFRKYIYFSLQNTFSLHVVVIFFKMLFNSSYCLLSFRLLDLQN